jgi:hypothetical protein
MICRLDLGGEARTILVSTFLEFGIMVLTCVQHFGITAVLSTARQMTMMVWVSVRVIGLLELARNHFLILIVSRDRRL